MNSYYEAKVVKEDDKFIFEFPHMENFEVAKNQALSWISDHHVKVGDVDAFYIRHDNQLIKIQ